MRETEATDFDVVILGGGLAGLTLARQLRREVPAARVAVIERQKRPLPDAAHKVGESSVELSSHYFGQMLGLGAYLRERQLIKNGLRFFPGGGHTHKLEERWEIGPPELPKVPSFQLDRGRLESDLREMDERDGVTLLEGFSVRDVALAPTGSEAPHVVSFARLAGDDERTASTRWVVDASGWRGILRNQLGLTRPSGHLANASWWRVKGRVDVADLVPASERGWHARDPEHVRWYSTVHFMGTGYWFWYIPLSTGHTSLGIVVHDEVHPFDTIRTLERSMEWLKKHEPQCYEHVKDMPAEDFLCHRHYSHGSSKCFSPDRWTTVGPAGVFADPFYSPGSDFIALGNCFSTELIRMDLAGEDFRPRADEYDGFYLRFFDVACEVYRKSAPCLGSPRPVAAKIYWDDFNYWAFVCQYFFKECWKLPPAEHARFVDIARDFAVLHFRAQKLVSEWAKRQVNEQRPVHVQLPPIPSVLANLHLDLVKPMSHDETLAYMREKLAQAHEVLHEIVIRAFLALGPTGSAELARVCEMQGWGMRISPERLAAETTSGGARRRALPAIARDMERCLGRPDVHPESPALLALVEGVLGRAVAAEMAIA